MARKSQTPAPAGPSILEYDADRLFVDLGFEMRALQPLTSSPMGVEKGTLQRFPYGGDEMDIRYILSMAMMKAMMRHASTELLIYTMQSHPNFDSAVHGMTFRDLVFNSKGGLPSSASKETAGDGDADAETVGPNGKTRYDYLVAIPEMRKNLITECYGTMRPIAIKGRLHHGYARTIKGVRPTKIAWMRQDDAQVRPEWVLRNLPDAMNREQVNAYWTRTAERVRLTNALKGIKDKKSDEYKATTEALEAVKAELREILTDQQVMHPDLGVEAIPEGGKLEWNCYGDSISLAALGFWFASLDYLMITQPFFGGHLSRGFGMATFDRVQMSVRRGFKGTLEKIDAFEVRAREGIIDPPQFVRDAIAAWEGVAENILDTDWKEPK